MAEQRLWRMRKLHQSVDAELHVSGGGTEVRYLLNGAISYVRAYPDRGTAIAAAAARRAELERDGWMFHW